jgi:hypothetical protein
MATGRPDGISSRRLATALPEAILAGETCPGRWLRQDDIARLGEADCLCAKPFASSRLKALRASTKLRCPVGLRALDEVSIFDRMRERLEPLTLIESPRDSASAIGHPPSRNSAQHYLRAFMRVAVPRSSRHRQPGSTACWTRPDAATPRMPTAFSSVISVGRASSWSHPKLSADSESESFRQTFTGQFRYQSSDNELRRVLMARLALELLRWRVHADGFGDRPGTSRVRCHGAAMESHVSCAASVLRTERMSGGLGS